MIMSNMYIVNYVTCYLFLPSGTITNPRVNLTVLTSPDDEPTVWSFQSYLVDNDHPAKRVRDFKKRHGKK